MPDPSIFWDCMQVNMQTQIPWAQLQAKETDHVDILRSKVDGALVTASVLCVFP